MSDEHDDDDETLVLSGFSSGAFFMERYRIERLLGTGAMGKVFRATDTAEDRAVALKVLHPRMARKHHVTERFRREAEILRKLGHPGIVRVYDSGRAPGGVDYLTMELLEGRTLKDRLREEGPMRPEALLPLLVQICDALGAAHVQGVVHRDLKPDNLFLLEGDARVKVVDFGLSRLSLGKRMTKTGTMLGTPRYMAPEQIRSAKDADARTDQYALGVIVHEALCGASPFPADDPGQLLGCVMEGRIRRLEEEAEVPERLAEVVRRAMARDRKDRFATIGAFAEAFAEALGRPTGRSMLVEQGAGPLEALFSEADSIDASKEVDLQDPVVVPREPPDFTRPPTPPPPEPAPPGRPRRGPARGWLLFLLLLVAVTCVSAAVAFGIRAWLASTPAGAEPAPASGEAA